MVCFPPTFLYILINMSPFCYDRYFYCRPVRGVFTQRGRVKEATSEILYTNRRVWSEPVRVFLHDRNWWDGHTSMVKLRSKSDPYTELQWDEETPSWALGACICLTLLSLDSLSLFYFFHIFNKKRKEQTNQEVQWIVRMHIKIHLGT